MSKRKSKVISSTVQSELGSTRGSKLPASKKVKKRKENKPIKSSPDALINSQIGSKLIDKSEKPKSTIATVKASSADYTKSELSDQVQETTSIVPNNVFVFTLGELKSVQKPIKNYVYFAKTFFLIFQTFNIIYLSVAFYLVFTALNNKDFKMLILGEIGLSVITIVFSTRIIKSLYGIYGSLFAKSRRPLYLFLLFNYFVSVIYILTGIALIFSPFVIWRFDKILENHLENLQNHKSNEKPTWYLIENAQHYGHCCGRSSFIDYLTIYAKKYNTVDLFRENYFLPLTCCKNSVNDVCTVYKKDIILKGCTDFIQDEVMHNVGLTFILFLITDVLSLMIAVYMMRRFKDNLVRIEIKEDHSVFLEREEARMIRELLAANFIKSTDREKIKDIFRKTIEMEQTYGYRPTMEGITIIIRKEGEYFEVRALNIGLFKIGGTVDYKYIEEQFKTGFADLFKKEEKKVKEEKKIVEKIMLPSQVKEQNKLLMGGGEALSVKDAEKNIAEFGLEKKILPWAAVRTRNAVVAINKKLDKSKNLKEGGITPLLIRFNSLDIRLDKHKIECDLKELKDKGEGISNEVKNKIASSKIAANEEEKMNIKIYRKDNLRPKNLVKDKKPIVKTTSDIIEDQGSDDDEWDDIRRNK